MNPYDNTDWMLGDIYSDEPLDWEDTHDDEDKYLS